MSIFKEVLEELLPMKNSLLQKRITLLNSTNKF